MRRFVFAALLLFPVIAQAQPTPTVNRRFQNEQDIIDALGYRPLRSAQAVLNAMVLTDVSRALGYIPVAPNDFLSALGNKADVSALAGKADLSALVGKADVTALANKANLADLVPINATLALKANAANLGVANVIVNGTTGTLAGMLTGRDAIGGIKIRTTALTPGVDIFQDPRTTAYTQVNPRLASLVLNNWIIGSGDNPDSVPLAQGFAFGIGLNFRNYIGGPTMTGGREGFVFETVFQTPSSPTNPNRNYVPLATQMIVAASDNGTGLTAATAAGAHFGINPNIMVLSGSINNLNVTGGEVNTAMHAGSSTVIKSGWSIVGRPDDQVQGSGIDTMLSLSNQSGAVSWENGIYIHGGNGAFPISPTGCILCTGVADGAGTHATIKSGIDLRNNNFVGGPAFASSGYIIDGFGNMTVQAITAGLDTADPHVYGRLYLDTATNNVKFSRGP